MWTIIAALILPPVAGYMLDRWKYGREILSAGRVLVPLMPAGTPRELAERAVLAANAAEIARAADELERAQREHAENMAAIESGSANVGDLYRKGK